MTDLNTTKTGYIPIEIVAEPAQGLGIPFLGRSSRLLDDGFVAAELKSQIIEGAGGPQAICDDFVGSLGLASPEALGISPEMQLIGLGPMTTRLLEFQLGETFGILLPILLRGLC